MKKYFYLLLFTLHALLFTAFIGCDRTFDTEITFEGQVYYGTESEGKITVLGPLLNARVMVAGHSESTATDSLGRYSLTIKAVRTYTNNNYDSYTLEASGTSSPGIYPSGKYVSQEMVVYGKSGDTIPVRDFLLYEHNK
ncbi:MAG: hypothetical protein WC947_03680 [Elusimicrobiota bacterium]